MNQTEYQAILQSLQAMKKTLKNNPKASLQFLKDAGILTKKGQLAPSYRNAKNHRATIK